MAGRAVPEGIRITKVGVWYVLITLLVGFAGANTGNNALQIVEAMLLAVLVVSGISSRRNVRKLEFDLDPLGEIYAEQPKSIRLTVRNLDRHMARRLLVVRCSGQSTPIIVPNLGRQQSVLSRLDLRFSRRGRVSIPFFHVASIYPLGIFHKGQRYPIGLDFLVYPEIQPATSLQAKRRSSGDSNSSQRLGRGHELFSLRGFRSGDDQRSVHWKRTAQTGSMIVVEREAEHDQRLTILLENGVGEPRSQLDRDRFERLVSEAATATHHYLESGYEIELLSRDRRIPFGRGQAHRTRVMEYLALVEPAELSERPLAVLSEGSAGVPRVHISASAGAGSSR